jgi:hypothetical protein
MSSDSSSTPPVRPAFLALHLTNTLLLLAALRLTTQLPNNPGIASIPGHIAVKFAPQIIIGERIGMSC